MDSTDRRELHLGHRSRRGLARCWRRRLGEDSVRRVSTRLLALLPLLVGCLIGIAASPAAADSKTVCQKTHPTTGTCLVWVVVAVTDRSEERRVGKASVRTCRSRGSQEL